MIASLNAIIKVTNCQLTPKMFAEEMKNYTNNFTNRRGLFIENSSWSNMGEPIIDHYISHYNVHAKKISKSDVKLALSVGHAVIAGGARGDNETNKVFSANGHYVMFSEMNGNNVIIKNPASSAFSNVSFETATAFATKYWEVWK